MSNYEVTIQVTLQVSYVLERKLKSYRSHQNCSIIGNKIVNYVNKSILQNHSVAFIQRTETKCVIDYVWLETPKSILCFTRALWKTWQQQHQLLVKPNVKNSPFFIVNDLFLVLMHAVANFFMQFSSYHAYISNCSKLILYEFQFNIYLQATVTWQWRDCAVPVSGFCRSRFPFTKVSDSYFIK